MSFRSGWNLPPGCFTSDLPGNSPEDERREAMWEAWLADLEEDGELGALDALDEEQTQAAFEAWLAAQPCDPMDAGIEPDDEPL